MRAIIDFANMTILDAAAFSVPFKQVRQEVLPAVSKSVVQAEGTDMERARRDHLDRWWQFWNVRIGLRKAVEGLKRFIVCPRVTKRPVFCFVDSAVLPDNALQAFAFEDDYSFGILQADAHWQWFTAKCSKLKSDYRYGEGVWNTFPWPQAVRKQGIREVAKAGRNIRKIRERILRKVEGGLRGAYRNLELPGDNPLKDAHAALDRAVLEAYGFSEKDDLLAQLLALNLEVAERIEKNKPVTAPGMPENYGDPADLITADCIQPD